MRKRCHGNVEHSLSVIYVISIIFLKRIRKPEDGLIKCKHVNSRAASCKKYLRLQESEWERERDRERERWTHEKYKKDRR